MDEFLDRRRFLRMSAAGTALFLPSSLPAQETGRTRKKQEKEKAEDEEDVAPAEDDHPMP